MSYTEVEISEKKWSVLFIATVIVAVVAVIILFILLCIPTKAHADLPGSCATPSCMHENSIRPLASDIQAEKITPVDRYDVDFLQNDSAVLTSGVRSLTKNAGEVTLREHPEAKANIPSGSRKSYVTTKWQEDHYDLSGLPNDLAMKVREKL